MRFLIFAGLYVLASMNFFFSETSNPQPFDHQKRDSAEQVLKKVSDKLNQLKTLKYKYHTELNYSSEGYHNEIAADSYLDFTSVDKIIDVKYQFSNAEFLTVFNGSETFSCDKKNKLIRIERKPTSDSLKSVSFLFNSPVTLRNTLPVIITDASIPKTMTETSINNRNFYVIEFVLDKKVLNRLGGYLPMTVDRKTIYRLTVDKSNYLPVELLQTNNANQDFMKTGFSDIETDSGFPDELSWYYSTYLQEYKIKEAGEKSVLIAAGQAAPDWLLPVFETDESVSLDQFKNKVVMLEFWISHCGYCIAAVPKLNALANRFKNKDFKLLAVNVEDPKEIIKLFQKNNHPDFEILSDGEKITKTYGVDRFPTIVLIDKSGKIIYSGNFDNDRLEELINKNIN